MKKKWIGLFAAAIFVLAGCQSKPVTDETKNGKTDDPKASGEIVLAAAASLKNAFDNELIPEFSKKYPDIRVSATYDSSGKLMTQIEGGLEADLFFSAAPKQMNELVEKGIVEEADRTDLLENQVVVITQKDSEKQLKDFAELKDVDSVAIGDPASVPAGQYAQKILTNAGVWDAVSAKASLGTNVTEVLNWVSQKSADYGIVYATDAASKDDVKVLLTADRNNLPEPPVYPVAMTKNGKNRDAAQLFYDFLKSKEAISVFEKYGFIQYNHS